MTTIDVNDVLTGIARGDFDDTLDRMRDVIRTREKMVEAQAASELAAQIAEGDRIQIRAGAPIGPKYLLELPLIVKSVTNGKASCDVESPFLLRSQRYARGIRVPLGYCEKLPAKDGDDA